MSVDKRIAFAVSASWLSRFITISLGLILMPVLFRRLGQEELGLWFMLGQSGAFLGLLDLGVTPTITRRIALAKGRSGGDPDVPLTDNSKKEIIDLIASSRIIYRFLSFGVFLIAWISGVFFIGQIELVHLSHQTIWIAWTVMCLSHSLAVWAALWSCLLQGMGHVGWDSLFASVINIAVLCTQIALVLMGGGLIALATVAALGSLSTRCGMYLFIRRRQPGLFYKKGAWESAQVKSMIAPAFKAWVTGLGAFMILKTDQYFIAFFRGVDDIPAYHAAYQIVANLSLIAFTFASVTAVFISQLWQAGELNKAHILVRRNVRLALIIMVCGSAFLGLVGEEVFTLWLGEGHFIGYPVLFVFCIMLTLETQHMVVASASRATEDEPFALWALGAGILNLIFTYLFMKKFGLLGVAMGTMFAQILTNNWYAVYRGLRRLKMGIFCYIKQVILPIFYLSCAFEIIILLQPQISQNISGFVKVIFWFVVVAIICVLSISCIALDANDRFKICSKFKLIRATYGR